MWKTCVRSRLSIGNNPITMGGGGVRGGGGVTVFVVGVDFYFNSCAWFS